MALPSWRDDPRANDPNWSFSMEKGWQKVLPSWRDDPRANDPTQSFSMEGGWRTLTAGEMAAKQAAAQKELLDRQKSEQEGLFGQYTTALQGQEALPAMYQRLQTEQGLPELQQQAGAFKGEIYRVKNLLDRLGEDVASRTRGTYTTESMRNRIIASEGGEMRTELGRLGTGLEPIAEMISGAQGQINTLLPLSMQQQAKELQPLEMRINALGDRFAREITGFNTDREQQFEALMDRIERDRELSDREWELAQQLAAEQREFARNKQLATISAGQYLNKSSGSTQGASTSSSSGGTRQLPVIQGSGVPYSVETLRSLGIPLGASNTGGSLPKLLPGTNPDPFGLMKRLGG